MKSILKYAFVIGLFIVPFIFWPYATIVYEVPRVWFVLRWIEALSAVSLIIVFTNPFEKSKKDNKLVIFALAFLVICSISSLLGVDPAKSLLGNYFRVDGLFTLLHLVGLFFILMLFWDKSWERLTVLSITVSAASVSLLLLIFNVTTFGQPNFLAGYMAVALPFMGYLKAPRIPKLILGGIILATIFSSQSIGALLGVGIYLLIFFLLKRQISKTKILFLLAIFVLLAAGVSLLTLQKGSFIAESRERIITKGLIAFTKRPILGYGIANYDHAFDSVSWPIKFKQDVYVDKGHSTILEILITTGIFGIIAYFAILGRLFQRLVKEKFMANVLFITLLVYIIHAQTNIISIAEEIIFWIILGIVASTSSSKARTKLNEQ